MKTPFEQVMEQARLLNAKTRFLSRFGIYINLAGGCVNYELSFTESDSIAKKINKLGFFESLTQEEEIALQIGFIEECGNGFCDDSDIKEVNKFFGMNITRKMINKMNSEFI